MKEVEFWNWWLVDERTGKRRRSRWLMTAEDAQRYYPGAEPVAGTCELRRLPEYDGEVPMHKTPSGPPSSR